ncbi:heterokaryon incompatibility protein-domain-containing protein [Xylogone sp. PMI_703]|nr:heterokaryon incompatibility protein-domain-containing protein [Xylogone sp. PMI_703]
MSIRDLKEGEALIQAIERDFPEFSNWRRELAESKVSQCDICRSLDLDSIANYTAGKDGISRGFKQHQSWEELKACAFSTGCHVCKLFHFVRAEQNKTSDKSKEAISDGEIYLHRAASNLELKTYEGKIILDWIWFNISIDKVSKIFVNIAELIVLDFPEGEAVNDPSKALTTRLVKDDPASDEAFSRAQSWIDFCRVNHSRCKPNERVPLPTRVIDVQSYNTTGQVRLFVSNGDFSKYTALSHCWGGSSHINGEVIRTCTSENYDELQNGFDASRLPLTFQDAITVTHKLGIRYLWVDSLCIIQDSQEDWLMESARMGEVYGNSFITILASTAQNSDQAFLACRDPNRYIKARLAPLPKHPGEWAWIRWPASDGVWDQADRKINHRGWAFQEYSLSPRILEYAPTSLEWHCNEGTFNETENHRRLRGVHNNYKELMWILGLPDASTPTTTGSIPVYPIFVGSDTTINIYQRWYNLVEGYSGRNLTFETDRLPAISGLASKVREISGDMYMAGLWKGDFGAGLCWQRRGFGLLHRPSQYIAPSWSWASLHGCITHDSPSKHELYAEILDFNIKVNELNPLGEVYHGSITIKAPLKELKISQGTVWADYVELDPEFHTWTRRLEYHGKHELNVYNYDYALKDQEEVCDPRGTGMCSIRFDLGPPSGAKHVILLCLTRDGIQPIPEKGDTSHNFGIVLEKVESGDQYRRIGAFSVIDPEAGFYVDGGEYAALQGWNNEVVTII